MARETPENSFPLRAPETLRLDPSLTATLRFSRCSIRPGHRAQRRWPSAEQPPPPHPRAPGPPPPPDPGRGLNPPPPPAGGGWGGRFPTPPPAAVLGGA